MTGGAWVAAGLVATLAVVTMVVQTVVDMGEGKTLPGAVWHQVRYFTNLSVILTGALFGLSFVARRWVGGSWPSAAMVLMVMVAVVYHALLAATHHPEGLDVLVNISQHTALPLLVVVVWYFFVPKTGLGFATPMIWIVFPVAYAIYAIVRGLLDGKFPYFFLDPEKSGWLGVLGYVAGIAVVYYAISAVFIWVARRSPI